MLWLAANPFICRADSRWWTGGMVRWANRARANPQEEVTSTSLSLSPAWLAILSHASLLIGLFLLLIASCIAMVYYQRKNLMFSTPVIVSFINSYWDTQADKGLLQHWSFRDIEPAGHSSP